ncbi:MAG: transcriptional regulator, TrmB [Candidatus Berkelbacteria bacterium Athens1014_28]|uniref:Transcriptional regulator, TrmB n=1 Tax=Candidatus Berkelbacteria bacterium Athens1014_28 TaxID=2017145 RepID=A0A554LPT5_9BACT|nr:MAG: transcriptional regulator, TrmB [Candidatus Berkelbacteria bacterium Athens1014_28]
MSILNKLQKLSLSEIQSKAYIALLQIGEGSALQVSRNANLPKSTVFETLKSLNGLNLISKRSQGNKNIFFVSDPRIILDNIKEQARTAEDILPELRGLYKAFNKNAQVRFFEGPKAIEIIINETLMEAKELKLIGSISDTVEFYPKYFPRFSIQRVKRKIPLRILTNDSETAQENILLDKRKLRTTKIIQNKEFSSMIWMWSGKIGIIATRGKQFAMVIDEPGIFGIQTAMFDLIWDSLPESKQY